MAIHKTYCSGKYGRTSCAKNGKSKQYYAQQDQTQQHFHLLLLLLVKKIPWFLVWKNQAHSTTQNHPSTSLSLSPQQICPLHTLSSLSSTFFNIWVFCLTLSLHTQNKTLLILYSTWQMPIHCLSGTHVGIIVIDVNGCCDWFGRYDVGTLWLYCDGG